jgi:hypothetical protein
LLNQIKCQDAEVTGCDNVVDQFASTYAADNCLTMGAMAQSITELAEEFGNGNYVDQCIDLDNDFNSLTGGNLIQQSTAVSNV